MSPSISPLAPDRLPINYRDGIATGRKTRLLTVFYCHASGRISPLILIEINTRALFLYSNYMVVTSIPWGVGTANPLLQKFHNFVAFGSPGQSRETRFHG